MLSNIRLITITIAMALISTFGLISCGGGGSSATGSNTGTGTATDTSMVGISVAKSVTPSSAIPSPTGDVASDAIAWMNFRRANIGLPPILRSALLDKAGLAHANYIMLNNSYAAEGHNETPGKSGFTGVTPGDRIRAAGYTFTTYGENLNGGTNKSGEILTDGLIDAPYHRSGQLGDFAYAGAGVSAMVAPSSISGARLYYAIDFADIAVNWGGKQHAYQRVPRSRPKERAP